MYRHPRHEHDADLLYGDETIKETKLDGVDRHSYLPSDDRVLGTGERRPVTQLYFDHLFHCSLRTKRHIVAPPAAPKLFGIVRCLLSGLVVSNHYDLYSNQCES